MFDAITQYFILGAIIGIISGNGLGKKYFQKGLFHKGHFVYKGKPYYSTLRLQATKEVLRDFASGLWKTISFNIYNFLTGTARTFGW